jgi:hypothetical protein
MSSYGRVHLLRLDGAAIAAGDPGIIGGIAAGSLRKAIRQLDQDPRGAGFALPGRMAGMGASRANKLLDKLGHNLFLSGCRDKAAAGP